VEWRRISVVAKCGGKTNTIAADAGSAPGDVAQTIEEQTGERGVEYMLGVTEWKNGQGSGKNLAPASIDWRFEQYIAALVVPHKSLYTSPSFCRKRPPFPQSCGYIQLFPTDRMPSLLSLSRYLSTPCVQHLFGSISSALILGSSASTQDFCT
jgi:hypothetical protein